MKKLLCLLVGVAILCSMFSGCAKGNNLSSSDITITGEKSVEDTGDFPKLELSGSTVKILTSNPTIDDRTTNLLKEQYGAEVEFVTASWADIPSRLTSLVMSGDSPDYVFSRSDLSDYPSFIVNNLVQPIDSYINLDHKLYTDLKEAYDLSVWDGKHYLLISHIGNEAGVIYNKKIFEDNDMETPWDLYKGDKWTWDTFRDTAKELTVDDDRDGTPEVYGVDFQVPQPFYYSTGKTLGTIDGKNISINNNIKDPDLARAMNFLSDLVTKDKVAPNTISSSLTDFKNEKCAMLYGSAYPYIGPELKEMAQQGLLGFAPIPRDPNVDKYYTVGYYAAGFIPMGAKNPQGAVAFNAIQRYMKTTLNDEIENENWEKYKSENYLTDLNREQLDACQYKVTMLPTLTPWLDQGAAWLMVGSQSSWSTQLESSLPKIESAIDEMVTPQEYDPPTGPKVIDDFEEYGSDETVNIKKYILMESGDQGINIMLDKANSQSDGNYAAKITYTLDKALWGGISRYVNKTWNGNNTLQLWIKGDGSKQTIGLQFDTGDGARWAYNLEIESNEGKVYEVPFSDFEDAYSTGKDMDLAKISRFYISFGELSAATKTIYVDNIEAVAK